MKKINLLFTALITSSVVFAQSSFENYYNQSGMQTYSIKQIANLNYIVTGIKYNPNSILLLKISAFGDSLWSNNFTINGVGLNILIAGDSGYVITGYSYPNNDIKLIKTDSSGNLLWNKTYGGANNDIANYADITSDNGYVIVGTTESYGSGLKDLYILKTNNNGDSIWSKTYGGSNNDIGNCIQTTSDNGFIIVGTTNSFGAGQKDIWLLKTDLNGDTLWTKQFGGINDDEGNYVQQTQDSGYIILGTTQSFGSGIRNAYLIKTDASGNVIWSKNFNGNCPVTFGNNNLLGKSLKQTIDGGYILLTAAEPTLIRTNSVGDTLWTSSYHGLSSFNSSIFTYHYDNDIQITNDSGYVFTGVVYSEFGEVVGTIVKTNSYGIVTSNTYVDLNNRISIKIFPNPTSGDCIITGNKIDKVEILDLKGSSLFTGNNNYINISSFETGMYIVRVSSNGSLFYSKVIKR